MLEGPTVIISPLIALQKDQVDSIRDQNPAEALAVNSTRGSEIREGLESVEKGEVEYLFLAPEQLREARDHGEFAQGRRGLRCSGRRGALRQPVGPRFPPRLP